MDNPVRHPWDKWFKSEGFTLLRGKQYQCMPHSMAQQIRNAAHRKQHRVSIKIAGDKLVVTNLGPIND